ncbi:MAG: DUF6494 family protein [Acidiferrobacteraceae bacterium]|jgi:hypothetical protein
MDKSVIDQEKLTTGIRKFLKKVGITSQLEIERAVQERLAADQLRDVDSVQARMVLTIPALDMEYRIDGDIDLH